MPLPFCQQQAQFVKAWQTQICKVSGLSSAIDLINVIFKMSDLPQKILPQHSPTEFILWSEMHVGKNVEEGFSLVQEHKPHRVFP